MQLSLNLNIEDFNEVGLYHDSVGIFDIFDVLPSSSMKYSATRIYGSIGRTKSLK
jgi:hypothetical protein